MTLTLNLGVLDFPYTDDPVPPKRQAKAHQGKQRPRKSSGGKSGAQTTGDVATILEAKYHIMETFFDLHEEEIGAMFADSMAGVLESMVMGGPAPPNPFLEVTSALQARFKEFLEREEMDGTGTPGVPTKAARMGVNHRLKRKRGPPRPSFIDTGQYEAAFVAWVENH